MMTMVIHNISSGKCRLNTLPSFREETKTMYHFVRHDVHGETSAAKSFGRPMVTCCYHKAN